MLASGRITASEYLMYATFAVENIHTKRWLDGDYQDIQVLSDEIAKLEKAYGLKEGEYWLKADQPDEIRILNDKYEVALDEKFEQALREFGLDNLVNLWREDRAEYDRQREIGRRSIFETHDHITAVTSALETYEREAKLSAEAGAFYAATVMLGAAAEARLLAEFLTHPGDTSAALGKLNRAEKPRNDDPLHWSLEHLVIVAKSAGWIGTIENDDVGVNLGAWLLSLRDTRNLLHPGRHARGKPHGIVGSEEYVDGQFAYTALCVSLANATTKKEPQTQARRPSLV